MPEDQNLDQTVNQIDLDEVQTDSMDRIIAAAVYQRLLEGLDPEVDTDVDFSQALTEEDLAALAALGGPDEVISRCIARSSDDPSDLSVPATSSDGDTCAMANDDTVASPAPAVEKESEVGAEELVEAEGQVPTEAISEDNLMTCAELTAREELIARLNELESAQEVNLDTCYSRLRKIGRGFQGSVFSGEDVNDVSCMALKFFSPKNYGDAEAYREDMERLREVARVVHRIHHSNLIDPHRFREVNGIYVMAMHAVDGLDVRKLLKAALVKGLKEGIPPERWEYLDRVVYSRRDNLIGLKPLMAVNIIEKCLRSLSELHERGIVHGDIKPSNIMLDRTGAIRVVDIGSAHFWDNPPRQRTWTPRYAPPEFLANGEWTPQSDLASLGYVLIELLSGRNDFGTPSVTNESATTREAKRDRALLQAKSRLPDRLHEILPKDSLDCDPLVRLCRKLIARDPKDRFSCAQEALANSEGIGAWDCRVLIYGCGMHLNEQSTMKVWMSDAMEIARLVFQ